MCVPRLNSKILQVFKRSEEEVVAVVRKELCPAIRSLLEHGMNDAVKQIVHFTSFGCYPGGSRTVRGSNGESVEKFFQIVLISFHFWNFW